MNILLVILLIIVFIVVAISKFKIHPFITLLLAAIFVGFLVGMDGGIIIDKINEGFGGTLSSIGIIIGLGAIIGTFLERSGGTTVMARYLLKLIGDTKSPLAMNITGFLVSIPVFCDSGFIILSSLNKALSKKTGIPLVVFVVALSTGLYVSHVFVPPTPGPLAAAAALDADLGLVMIMGLLLAVPTALVGYFWAKWSGRKHEVSNIEVPDTEEDVGSDTGILAVFLPIFIPIFLIALRSIANYPSHPLGQGILHDILIFVGNPLIALFVGFLFATQLADKKTSVKDKLGWVSDALKDAGSIILITGAGGAFGNVLRAGNIGEVLETGMAGMQAGILLPFLLAAILKTAQGSSTVAIITTATIIAPLMGSLGLDDEISRALAVLAVGAGAMTVSHINDSYFWVVSQFSGMDTKATLRSHTAATFFQGITAIILLYIAHMLIN